MKHFFILAAAVFLLIACEEEMKPPSGSEEQPPTKNEDSTVPDTDPTPEPVTARVSGLNGDCGDYCIMLYWQNPNDEDFDSIRVEWRKSGETQSKSETLLPKETIFYTVENLEQTEYLFSVILSKGGSDGPAETVTLSVSNFTDSPFIGLAASQQPVRLPSDGASLFLYFDDTVPVAIPDGTTVKSFRINNRAFSGEEMKSVTAVTDALMPYISVPAESASAPGLYVVVLSYEGKDSMPLIWNVSAAE